MDGVECALGHDPRNSGDRPSPTECGGTGDSDGDRVRDDLENCKWGTDDNVIDTDGDTLGDCVEAADVNGDGIVDYVGDTMDYARAAMLDACPNPDPLICFGQDGDFDLNGNNIMDFVGDVIQEAKFALIAGLCK